MPPGDSDESQVFVNDYKVPNLPIGERGWGVHLKRSIISTRPHRYYCCFHTVNILLIQKIILNIIKRRNTCYYNTCYSFE